MAQRRQDGRAARRALRWRPRRTSARPRPCAARPSAEHHPELPRDRAMLPHATHGVIHIDLGAKGPETTFITGGFVLDDPLATPILAALPPLIRMTPDAEPAVPSFLENIQFITREVETNRPGSEIVLLRMADVMFIQILRAYLASSTSSSTAAITRTPRRCPPRGSPPQSRRRSA
ncbi:cupin domain-containing protein [Sorangium sp. So ce854]|uniref:cupin domain-containing protein n=1 Tax=Sorangium sp. So ce854 TaxID=3133322 RepID=UPI003F61F856